MSRDSVPFEARATLVDALLYAAAAIFALRVLGTSSMLRNLTWADLAWPAYTAGAVAALALATRGRAQLLRARLALAAAVFVGAVVVPLAVEVQWRTEPARAPASALHPYGASEVVVTEGAARALLRGGDPYAVRFTSPELARRSPSTADHFPYLPGMIAFGVPRALVPATALSDARLFFLAATVAAALVAVRRWRAPPERRLRALQVLLVLPTGAAALATGGDDVPVLALCLLALVLLDSGRHSGAAWTAAGAALLKLTAWPLLLALAVASPRRSRLPLGAVACVVLAAATAGPADFVDDVLLFPTGLANLPSPAATTTLGSMMIAPVSESSYRAGATVALLAAAALVAVCSSRALARRAQVGAAEVAAAAGAVLLALIVLSPVARAGYLVYPLDLFAWSVLLHRREAAPAPVAEAPEALAW
jgi:Glycosyltransferase family 87